MIAKAYIAFFGTYSLEFSAAERSCGATGKLTEDGAAKAKGD